MKNEDEDFINLIDLNIFISRLCYGPPDVGVRVLPVRF